VLLVWSTDLKQAVIKSVTQHVPDHKSGRERQRETEREKLREIARQREREIEDRKIQTETENIDFIYNFQIKPTWQTDNSTTDFASRSYAGTPPSHSTVDPIA